MSTSDLINLGMLVVAALGLASGAVYALYRWLRVRYFSVRMALDTRRHERLYIAGIRVRRNLAPTVSRVAAWCRLCFWNVGPEAKLITGVFTQEDGQASRELIGPPAKQVDFGYDKDTPMGAVELPLTLQPQSGICFWVLISIDVPEKLGEILFSLYGDQARTMPSFHQWNGRLAEAERFVLEGIHEAALPIKDGSCTIQEVEMTDPMLKQQGETLAFVPRLGSFPPHVYHKIIANARERGWRLEEVVSNRADSYRVHARLGSGKVLSRRLRIDQDALWWRTAFGNKAHRNGA